MSDPETARRIRRVDAALRRLPVFDPRVDALLDERSRLMADRDRGYRVSDRRRVTATQERES